MDPFHFVDDTLKLGFHSTFGGNIRDTIKRSLELGILSIQFFMGNPKSFARSKISESDIKETKELISRFPTSIFTHLPYIYNLCGSTKCLAWQGEDEQPLINKLKNIEYELSVLSNFGGGAVIHPGAFPDRNKGIRAISTSLNKINYTKGSKLLLENSAGQGSSLGTTFREIGDMIKGVNKSKQKYLGVVLDTCHLFAYGEYNISKVDEMKRALSDFDKEIGIDKLSLIHLNDSMVEFGKKTDRHEIIGNGYIWKENKDSLIYLLDFCREKRIPLVLETHPLDIVNVRMIIKNILG